ncbi:hypothetical protein QWY77_10230 [Thalassotalea ponticola]|uniref:hypothetical protein n=1 Tax=Thalassotalea ponticola TaxID=1523392 RepID=UPI0025B5ED7B|nr:hypothetical protein [Thalassotalea ponticola]MDN3653127.1 hypothetical protein [Thalassotalea ponticola]
MLLRVVLVFISVIIASSSFPVKQALEDYVLSHRENQRALAYAVELDITSAQRLAIASQPYQSSGWLQLATALARVDGHYAWLLSHYYRQQQDRRNQQYYFARAMRLHSASALFEQAKQYAEQQQYQRALDVLNPLLLSFATDGKSPLVAALSDNVISVAPVDKDTLLSLAIDWSIAVERLIDVRGLVAQLSTNAGQQWYKTLDQFQIMAIKSTEQQPTRSQLTSQHSSRLGSELVLDSNQQSKPITHAKTYPQTRCQYPIQFFASTVPHLQKLTEMFGELEPFYQQQFCLLTPRYLPPSETHCYHRSSERIHCQLSPSVLTRLPNGTRYVGVMVAQGGANVNNGMLFLDAADSSAVLAHELSHLLGFIDEYPLPQAHTACAQAGHIGHNVITVEQRIFDTKAAALAYITDRVPWLDLLDSDTPLVQPTGSGYRLGTPANYQGELGLFLTNTCNRRDLLSFKPVSELSNLEYYERVMPKVYQTLYQRASNKRLMASFFDNLQLHLL